MQGDEWKSAHKLQQQLSTFHTSIAELIQMNQEPNNSEKLLN